MEAYKFSLEWHKMTLQSLHGETLKNFLIDYTAIFKETVNPSCQTCLRSYHNKLSEYMKNIDNPKPVCDYELLKIREGLPLSFGSHIIVTNANLTNEYAESLFKRLLSIDSTLTLSSVFSKFPSEDKPAKEPKKGSKPDNDKEQTPEEKKKSYLSNKSREQMLEIASKVGLTEIEETATKGDIYDMIKKLKDANANTEES